MTMKIFRGRLFDHVHLRVASLEKSKRFYRAALAPLGIQATGESEQHINFDELWIDAADAAVYHGPGKRSAEAVEITAG